MKKFFVATIILIVCLISLTNIVSAEKIVSLSSNAKTIGIVIIGDISYKNKLTYKMIRKYFNPDNSADLFIKTGDDIQSNYIEFWARKGFLSEQPLTEENMIEFTGESDCDKIVYLVSGNFVTEYERIHSHSFLQYLLFGEGINTYTTSGTVFAFLCDKERLIYSMKTEYSVNSSESEKYGSDRGFVFRMCIDKIAKIFFDKL